MSVKIHRVFDMIITLHRIFTSFKAAQHINHYCCTVYHIFVLVFPIPNIKPPHESFSLLTFLSGAIIDFRVSIIASVSVYVNKSHVPATFLWAQLKGLSVQNHSELCGRHQVLIIPYWKHMARLAPSSGSIILLRLHSHFGNSWLWHALCRDSLGIRLTVILPYYSESIHDTTFQQHYRVYLLVKFTGT